MFIIVNVVRGLLLFTALFLPIAIIEEEFNFCIKYGSNPKLFSKYFFLFLLIKVIDILSILLKIQGQDFFY
jgi:hypothetical protein